jgi:hypothetical protein
LTTRRFVIPQANYDAHNVESQLNQLNAEFARDPNDRNARRRLVRVQISRGAVADALSHLAAELADAEGEAWLQREVWSSMESGDLGSASILATALSRSRWATRWYPPASDRYTRLPIRRQPRRLTTSKVLHDMEQLEYLLVRGLVSDELATVCAAYRQVGERLAGHPSDDHGLIEDDMEAQQLIGDVYNGLIHVRDTAVPDRLLGDSWDARWVEDSYLAEQPGVVVIDEFLSDAALIELQRFCVESTIWSTNRYESGRLGSFFIDGFNSDLLVRLDEEIRASFPRLIGNLYPLNQLWAMKSGKGITTRSTIHADFAAVNVNLWITPDDANLNPQTGGLIVYDKDAPLSWPFSVYNDCADRIVPFLKRHGAVGRHIPYRCNRAIVFNSDLFHNTDPVEFDDSYESRRINITFLYGRREQDVHHPRLVFEDATLEAPLSRTMPRRSAAFRSARRR